MPSPNGVVLRTKQHQLGHSGFNLWWSLSSRMDTSVTSWCSREKSGTPGRNDETTSNSLTTSSLWFKVSINFFCNNLCGSCKIRWNLLNATKCCCLWGKQYKDFSLHLALIQFICFYFESLDHAMCCSSHVCSYPKMLTLPPAKWNASFRFMTRTLGSYPTTSATSWWQMETPWNTTLGITGSGRLDWLELDLRKLMERKAWEKMWSWWGFESKRRRMRNQRNQLVSPPFAGAI